MVLDPGGITSRLIFKSFVISQFFIYQFVGLKEKPEAWKRVLESKGLIVNIETTQMVVSSENAGKVTIDGEFSCAVCRKTVGSDSIICQFWRCWAHKEI